MESSECATRSFAFGFSSVDDRVQFSRLAKEFLTAKSWSEAERYGRVFMRFVLVSNDKVQTLSPVIENLNIFEHYGDFNFPGQRLHFCHLANVFLLGLYIYHSFKPIRKVLDSEMERTTKEIEMDGLYKPHRYSGETKFGEFLYRWRMASLSHDIGTGIQLCEGEPDKISKCLDRISESFNKRIVSLDELLKANGRDILGELDNSCEEVSFTKYIDHQNSYPFPDSVNHDHGIFSAIIFLRLMHEEYTRHIHNPFSYTRSGRIFWHPLILSTSILQTAIAIAMHNLEKYPQALDISTFNVRIFDMHKRPLAWLLKISDILQEWDKYGKGDEALHFPVTRLTLRISNSKISVENFPEERRDQVREVIHKYTNPNNLVCV